MSPPEPGLAELATFRDEREHFQLLCTCESCIHGACSENTEAGPRCSLGFPNHQHLERAITNAKFVFCKSFEAT